MAGSELAYLKGRQLKRVYRSRSTCCSTGSAQSVDGLTIGKAADLSYTTLLADGRKDLPCGSNWLCLCSRCHRACSRLPEYGELPKVRSSSEDADGSVNVELLRHTGRSVSPAINMTFPKVSS